MNFNSSLNPKLLRHTSMIRKTIVASLLGFASTLHMTEEEMADNLAERHIYVKEFADFFESNFDLDANGDIDGEEMANFYAEIVEINELPQEEQWKAFITYGKEEDEHRWFPVTTALMTLGLDPFNDLRYEDF